MKRINLLVCFTGSVATIKDRELIDALISTERFNIRLVYTKYSEYFSTILKTNRDVYKNCEVILHEKEFEWKSLSDNVLHIDLKNWAESILIAPLSANTLAKIANGFCDNTVTLVLRALKFKEGKIVIPVFLAPAMNTDMYNHPITQIQLDAVKKWGFGIIHPIEKLLACKEVGIGAMETPEKIKNFLIEYFNKQTDGIVNPKNDIYV